MFIPADARVRLGSVASGKVLDAGDARAGDRVRQRWPARDRPGQWWRLVPVPGRSHQYRLVEDATGLVLTGHEGSRAGRYGVVALGSDPRDPRASWWVLPQADDEYALVNTATGLSLDLWDGADDDEALVGLVRFWRGPQQRWRLHTGVAPGGTRAVMTMVYNEEVLLPIWLGYYSRFFAPEDIYVLDHGTTDGSTDRPGFNRVPVHHDEFGVGWQRDTCQRFQHELLERYDVVLHTDVDEIVAPDPRSGDLGEYIDRFDDDFVTCTGYEVLHMKDTEPAYDPGRPVLDQRGTWFRNNSYSKPLLARVPMEWHGGFHERKDRAARRDPSLRLIHLHRFDYDYGLTRNLVRTKRRRARLDVEKGWGRQNRILDAEEFHAWFYHANSAGRPLRTEPVPEHWRHVV
ncbi:RICIN domain-containing protein [Saccharothrix saharensis]|uniref:RICIN domain-containing protein n=1 Tax=Saccharothrix saharensis TaxID=571190 RepID=UPI0036CFA8CE